MISYHILSNFCFLCCIITELCYNLRHYALLCYITINIYIYPMLSFNILSMLHNICMLKYVFWILFVAYIDCITSISCVPLSNLWHIVTPIVDPNTCTSSLLSFWLKWYFVMWYSVKMRHNMCNKCHTLYILYCQHYNSHWQILICMIKTIILQDFHLSDYTKYPN